MAVPYFGDTELVKVFWKNWLSCEFPQVVLLPLVTRTHAELRSVGECPACVKRLSPMPVLV